MTTEGTKRLTIELPWSLYQQLAQAAKDAGTSMTALACAAIREKLGPPANP